MSADSDTIILFVIIELDCSRSCYHSNLTIDEIKTNHRGPQRFDVVLLPTHK